MSNYHTVLVEVIIKMVEANGGITGAELHMGTDFQWLQWDRGFICVDFDDIRFDFNDIRIRVALYGSVWFTAFKLRHLVSEVYIVEVEVSELDNIHLSSHRMG